MVKQFGIVFILMVLISVVTFAQENPVDEKVEKQNTTELTNDQSNDSELKNSEAHIWNKVCPVKGNPVEEDTPTVEYDGKLYGFCCPGCDTKFAKNPEKYAKNLSEDGSKYIGRK